MFAAVAGVAAPGQELARRGPGRADVAALAVGDPPRLAAGAVLEEELVVLGTPFVHVIEELVVPGPGGHAQDALGQRR